MKAKFGSLSSFQWFSLSGTGFL